MGAPDSDLVPPSDGKTNGKRPIRQLTGARFFAAAWVVCFHTLSPSNVVMKAVVAGGYLGVPFFFALSGVVLTYSYGDRMSKVGQRQFLQARFARIYPALVLATVLATVVALVTHEMKSTTIAVGAIATLTFLFGWFPLAGPNGPVWSLTDEAFFYLFFRKALGYAGRLSRTSSLKPFAVTIGLGVLGPLLFAPFVRGRFEAQIATIVLTNPVIRFPTFFAGILIGVALFQGKGQIHEALMSRIALVTSFLTTLLVIGVAGYVLSSQSAARFQYYQAISSGLMLIPISVLLVRLTTGRPQGGLSRLMASGSLELLGEASYSMYLLHVPLWSITEALCPTNRFLGIPIWPGYFGCVVLVSLLSFKWVETPLRHRLRPKELTTERIPRQA